MPQSRNHARHWHISYRACTKYESALGVGDVKMSSNVRNSWLHYICKHVENFGNKQNSVVKEETTPDSGVECLQYYYILP
jgi:Uri superfamily endonuclease